MTRIFLILRRSSLFFFKLFIFLLFSVKTPRSQCLPSLSKKVTGLSSFFLNLAIWQIFGSIQPNFLRKFWLFYVKTNDLQPVSCFVPVLAFVCLDFFEYKYSAAESRWVCRRAKIPTCAARAFSHFSFKFVNISKNSSKWQRLKIDFLGEFNFQSKSGKKCRLYGV